MPWGYETARGAVGGRRCQWKVFFNGRSAGCLPKTDAGLTGAPFVVGSLDGNVPSLTLEGSIVTLREIWESVLESRMPQGQGQSCMSTKGWLQPFQERLNQNDPGWYIAYRSFPRRVPW